MHSVETRREWMSLMARAPAGLVTETCRFLEDTPPAFGWLRAPETGGVMVQGRAGGTGAAFNLGEMTVTRCALRLESGEVGHSLVQGRDKRKARLAALCDALMQTDRAGEIREKVLGPVAAAMAAAKAEKQGKAAATKVDFFTMVRGED
jgi:alpha-D-ribose 1-methylphosphonate 5-triphosphate synthase subunit PhnG